MTNRVGQAALDRAFDQQNLVPVYQPIHDARTRGIVAAEALLRQRRESGEIREAGIITEAAEDGTRADLYALDSIVVKMAYDDAVHWHAHGAPEVRLNVNLSPREFQEGNVMQRLEKLVTGCGIQTSKINLEITETAYIEHPEQTMDILTELKQMGIAIWLDDFGTGHSSIQHLQHFPLDGLKIPKEFVSALPHDLRCRAITGSLIRLGHELGIEIIAEGVEKEDQLQFLLDQGCDYIQGFLFSRPMLRDEFEKFVMASGHQA
jgi:EAL domain-containing protein (putative c-di-GMP-specific phosphodiesterase class I)